MYSHAETSDRRVGGHVHDAEHEVHDQADLDHRRAAFSSEVVGRAVAHDQHDQPHGD